MQIRSKTGGLLTVLAGFCALATVFGMTVSARAQDAAGRPEVRTEQQKPARASTATSRRKAAAKPAPAPARYFVEFRSRYAASYGHTFLAHGRLNAKGEIVESEVAGLHPATDSSVPWMIGHLVPVPSETGPSDGDLEDQYVSARYRVELSEAEYEKVAAFIRKQQANSPLWHAVLYNCNAWVGGVARFMGLRTPASSLLMRADYINSMRDLNSTREPSETASFTSMQ